jgi:hypothetical protein
VFKPSSFVPISQMSVTHRFTVVATRSLLVHQEAAKTGILAPSATHHRWRQTNTLCLPAHAQGSNFPGSNLCYKPFNDDYKFFVASTDTMRLIGEKSVANTRVTYTNPADLYLFPQAFAVPNMDSVEGTYPDGFISNVTRKGWYQTSF